MIDFSTIQTFPIPPEIQTLQNQMSVLKDKNKVLRKILLTVAIGGAVYIGYQIYKYFKNDESEQSKNCKSDQKINQIR